MMKQQTGLTSHNGGLGWEVGEAAVSTQTAAQGREQRTPFSEYASEKEYHRKIIWKVGKM